MKRGPLILLLFVLLPAKPFAQSTGEDPAIELRLQDAPLAQAAELYSTLSKCMVKIEPGLYPTTTLRTDHRVSRIEALQLLEGAWRSNGIVVIKRVLPCKVFLFPDPRAVPDELRDDPPTAVPPIGLERRVIRKPWEQPDAPDEESPRRP